MEDFRKVFRALEASLEDMPRQIGMKPRAELVISGHWEERDFTVMGKSPPADGLRLCGLSRTGQSGKRR